MRAQTATETVLYPESDGKPIVVKGKENTKVGETLNYVIHSPARTFQCSADEAKGKKYEFTETLSGDLRSLDAKPVIE